MLTRLSIQNYVLIEQLEITFHSGLSIITGETGAGKSILLGAFGLILGNRADSRALLDTSRKCIIEGEFNISGYNLKDFFYSNELDYEPVTIIRREITPDGKSRSFVNDTPVNLSVLRSLASRLVDIHSQHESLTLSDPGFRLRVIDSFAGHKNELQQYRSVYSEYVKLHSKLAALQEAERKSKSDAGYFEFLFNELEEAGLKEGEQMHLENELQELEHAGEIKTILQAAVQQVEDADENILNRLHSLIQQLNHIAKYSVRTSDAASRIKSVVVELKDIAGDLRIMEDEIQHNPAREEWIQQRLDQINRLLHKHQVTDEKALLRLQAELESKLHSAESLAGEIAGLTNALTKHELELRKRAGQLSTGRKKASLKIEKQITAMLAGVGLPEGNFRIEIKDTDEQKLNETGRDEACFLFSANKGVAPAELSVVASGGELSRLMLCIKSLLAQSASLPTILFDEIDSGISGEVAVKVASIIHSVAERHQVIAITHLPQMAARGHSHYLVFKENAGKRSQTRIRLLSEEERISEIATMIAGKSPSGAALKSARELLEKE